MNCKWFDIPSFMDGFVGKLRIHVCAFLLGGMCISGFSSSVRAQTFPEERVRPDHINNAESPYFPPVFNQHGGSCGSASRIGYMFAHEINAYRRDSANCPEHIYPTHFTWLLTNSHSGKEGMARANGVPNASVYGGPTYSRLFGNQDCAHMDFGWMQGYDKWYSAMFNRISHNSFSPYGVDTEQGREYIKNWLWNHQGDESFAVGGICGIGVASACKQGGIENDPEGRNVAAGVVGMKYVTRWGDGVDHALTIVGYDDRIVFDLDSNKVYGEKDKDECGAWIIVNSWGNGWANKGFIYCPYKYGFPVRQHEGGAWRPEFYHVRKEYRPMRTLRLLMDYSRRSELKLLVGIASDTTAAEPEKVIEMEHFKFAGDGRADKNKPLGMEAETPMLGKWADGKLHGEPMEFGYDLTDLTASFDKRRPLKYFFIVESRRGAVGQGMIYQCSVLDYEFDRDGVETDLTDGYDIAIRNQGQRTVIASVVWGESFCSPRNPRIENGLFAWDLPQESYYPLRAFVVQSDKGVCDTLDLAVRNYPCGDVTASYSVAALYEAEAGELYHGEVPYGVRELTDNLVHSCFTPPVRMDIPGLYPDKKPVQKTKGERKGRKNRLHEKKSHEQQDRRGLADSLSLDIRVAGGVLYAGQEFELRAQCAAELSSLDWILPEHSATAVHAKSVELVCHEPGVYPVELCAVTHSGDTLKARKELNVMHPERGVTIKSSKSVVAVGERISFRPVTPIPGHAYTWSMRGSSRERARAVHAATVYDKPGYYTVKLRARDAEGRRVGHSSMQIFVELVPPKPAFDISSGVVYAGDKVTLTDRSRNLPDTWLWRIENGSECSEREGKKVTLEMEKSGVYDITLKVSNRKGQDSLTNRRAVVVCAADSKNGLDFGAGKARVHHESPLGSEKFRELLVEWWMDASAQGATSGMGAGRKFWQIWADAKGNMRFAADSAVVASGAGFVQPGAWHHYAVSFKEGSVRFYRDGRLFHSDTLVAQRTKKVISEIPVASAWSLGGEKHVMNAAIDELRIWRKTLPDSLLVSYANAPLSDMERLMSDKGLLLYYDFNQNGGAVHDRCSRQDTGVRLDFGPDGDAWGLSKGVFSLTEGE